MGHLTLAQRYTIETLIKARFSQTAIAGLVGVDKSVINRELKRNRDSSTGEYQAEQAHRLSQERLKLKPHQVRFTPQVQAHVERHLSLGYSPEQITGRAKLDGEACVSHERIYSHVWLDKRQGARSTRICAPRVRNTASGAQRRTRAGS